MAGTSLHPEQTRTQEPTRARTRLSPQAMWRLAVALMVAGGALGGSDVIFPWEQMRATFTFHIGSGGSQLVTEPVYEPVIVALERVRTVGAAPRAALYSLLAVAVYLLVAVGALIALALVTRQRPRIRFALLLAYALWLAALLAQLLLSSALLVTGHGAQLTPVDPTYFQVDAVTPSLGLWVGWLAALLGVGGLISARWALRRGLAPLAGEPAARKRVELASAGLATVGVAVWACGFFTLPWATQGCPNLQFSLNHFVRGTCAGLDAADTISRSPIASALMAGYHRPNGNAIVSLMVILLSPTVLYALSVTLAVWALARLWLGPRGATRYGWLLAWLVISCCAAALAAQGAVAARANQTQLIYGATDPWVSGPGLVVTLVGLALAALGLISALTNARGVARSRTERH